MPNNSSANYLLTVIPMAIILVIVAKESKIAKIEPGILTRDVAAITNILPLSGALSKLGMLLGSIAVVVC